MDDYLAEIFKPLDGRPHSSVKSLMETIKLFSLVKKDLVMSDYLDMQVQLVSSENFPW